MNPSNLLLRTPNSDPPEPIDWWSQVPQSFPANKNQTSIVDYLDILRKRTWLIVWSIACTLLLAAIATLMMTPVYEAVTRIAIYREAPGGLNLQESNEAASEDSDYTVSLDTQAAILEGDALASEVIKQLKLEANPAFIGNPSKLRWKRQRSRASRSDSVLRTFQQDLKVVKLSHTRLLEIRFLHSNPDLASQIANTLATVYIDHTFRTKYDSTMQASHWLGQQLADLQVKVDESQGRLVAYQKKYGILGGDDSHNIVNSALNDINKDVTEAEADRIGKEASYRLLLSSQPDVIGLESNVVLQHLRSERNQLSAEYALATSKLGPSHPRVIALISQLKDVDSSIGVEVERVGDRIRNEYYAAVHREKMLRAALEAQKETANRQNENSIEYDELKREAQSNRELYDNLLRRLKEATLAAGLRSNNVRIEEVARPPLWPSKPRLSVNLAWGSILGLFGGVALALILEGLDNTVCTLEQAEQISSLPALGVIPLGIRPMVAGMGGWGHSGSWPELLWHRTISIPPLPRLTPQSPMLESYRSLRSVLLLVSARRPPQVILFTSALSQEGKTTTAVNVAIALAERGRRVLLIDADFRKPTVHDVMQLNSTQGLTTALLEKKHVLDFIVQMPEQSNLSVLPAGPIPPNPAQLLSHDGMGDLLDICRKHFDYIVIDAPPVLLMSDSLELSAKADAVLLVVRAMKTTRPALARTCDLLRKIEAPVFGVVVNGIARSRGANPYWYLDASSVAVGKSINA
jgi:succinoglycan biosynthesis transport protein ExoP